MLRASAVSKSAALLCLCLTALLLVGACSKKKAAAGPQNRIWSEHIAGHTAGLVSRHGEIAVRFVHDVVEAGQVGKSADDYLDIEPSISGEPVFASAREIVLKPKQQLKPGESYRVRIEPKKLKDVPKELPPYEFSFHVIQPQFEVDTAVLDLSQDVEEAFALRGKLETADGEDPDAVEKLLSATLNGKAMALRWAHANGNRSHEFFSAEAVKRGDQDGELVLAWNGKPLDIDNSGTRKLEVPKRGEFKIMNVALLNDGRQSVQVHFSDSLDPNQNLNSLITLGQTRVTTRVEGNALNIYPETAVNGEFKLGISDAVRNARGTRLGSAYETTVAFANEKPQVRFAGKGVILPANDTLEIPFEAMNVHSVQVTAFQIYDNDVGQFLQSNNLSGDNELQRVGRHLWRKTIQLPKPTANRWTRYSLDASELLGKHPGALFRLSLTINRGNSIYACSEEENKVAPVPEEAYRNNEDLWETEGSSWDGSEEYYDYESDARSGEMDWNDRDNPCKDAYYRWGQGTVRDARNFLASNIGLLAKRGTGGALHVVATQLRDAKPLSGAEIEVRNFQNQVITTAKTDNQGFANIEMKATPFYIIARTDKQIGYLKLNRASALPVSHFDVGGETLSAGLKGYIYGERGVWRPGDDIYLNFVVLDRTGRVPEGHPATMQLFNPKGQLVQTLTNTTPVGDFYKFTLKTAEDAPTGTWTAKALVGGAEFSKQLKIETVMPNRLKMELKIPGGELRKSEMPKKVTLSAQWLHGATASGLKADIAAKLNSVPTKFPKFGDFIFDDPARTFTGDREMVHESRLDDEGKADITLQLAQDSEPPGLMQASFTTRVFESGGAFSTSHSSYPYHPYERYIGLKLPKVEQYGWLASDKPVKLELASTDTKGEGVSASNIEISVYHVEWRWWWDRVNNRNSEYAEALTKTPVTQLRASIKNGRGQASFQFEGAEIWGRYLIRACDLSQGKGSGHCTGQVVYFGYSGWDSNQQDDSAGATALRFTSDKPKYNVGEKAKIQLPAGASGTALLSLENGSGVLEQRWIKLEGDKPSLELPVTAKMTPNVYLSLTLLQPHAGKNNDRPIRLYGILPIEVLDPETVLTPVITSDKLWRPNGKVSVEVSEANNRSMTYTLAVVDEGLLGLTNFKTPNAHESFFKREALGVSTWDLFDEVAGAYGAELERLLALGGDSGGPITEKQEQKRFPPVVRVLGPFQLKSGKQKHEIDLPQYIGEVRVMVVAGSEGAYGSAEKGVIVREPLSLLATLPRVLGPGESIEMPVSVFAYENDVREVKLNISTDANIEVVGSTERKLSFQSTGERMAYFSLKAKNKTSTAQVTVNAASGSYKSKTSIALPIRSSNPVITRQLRKVLKPGETWDTPVTPFGIANSNAVALEVSRVPPMDLERRLQYLIQYPHGCVEQTTSSVFPQLYLGNVMELDEKRRTQIEGNIKAGITRLRSFQIGTGGFAYWPGESTVNAWASNYAGHYLAEAKRLGYHVPSEMFDPWVQFQKSAATSWRAGGMDDPDNQAYRLLTLALADQAEVGAMNRLREYDKLSPVARWQLAAAYAHIGLSDAARDVMRGSITFQNYAMPGPNFASETRDRGILLNALLAMGDLNQAERIAEDLAKQLSSDSWYSTQSTAYALMAMARFGGGQKPGESFEYSYAAGKDKPVKISAKKALSQRELPQLVNGGPLKVTNGSKQNLFVHVVQKGSPPPGEEDPASSEGLSLSVNYTDRDGKPLSPDKLSQGLDFFAEITVSNHSGLRLEDLALTQIVAAGWEIHNPRFEEEGAPAKIILDYQDIRDDRVMSYFALNHGESRSFRVLLNAAYLGRYYLPAVSVESMYDARKHASTKGQWTVVAPR